MQDALAALRNLGDKAAADEAFRAGLARLEAGDLSGALDLFRRAHAACPRSTNSGAKALVKVERYIRHIEESLAGNVVEEERGREPAESISTLKTCAGRVSGVSGGGGGDAAVADEAYRAGLAALQTDPPDRLAALAHMRRAEAACPAGKPAALRKIRKHIESLSAS